LARGAFFLFAAYNALGYAYDYNLLVLIYWWPLKCATFGAILVPNWCPYLKKDTGLCIVYLGESIDISGTLTVFIALVFTDSKDLKSLGLRLVPVRPRFPAPLLRLPAELVFFDEMY
jgi:hypothetical protein